MLKNTFCHIPGISVAAEHGIWSAGIHSWEAAIETDLIRLPRRQQRALPEHLKESFEHLERSNPYHFSELLPPNQHWRLFPDFRHTIAYLDIETTGLDYADSITTIVVYDGETIRHYVSGENLDDFKRDIMQYSVIVTYNGKCFDVPFIERFFDIEMTHSHIDLRYILKRLGYSGGLKGCERQLGIDRKDLADVDGFFAVLLWDDYERRKNPKVLETLLAYNTADVVNLETLMVLAYNMNLKGTPFSASHRIDIPKQPYIPFKADMETINRLRQSMSWGGYYGWR